MRTKDLTFVALVLAGGVGNSDIAKFTIAEMRAFIESGNVFEVLTKTNLKRDIEYISSETKAEVLEVWRELADACIDGKLCRNDTNGLGLLLCYTAEALQQRIAYDEKMIEKLQTKIEKLNDGTDSAIITF